MYGAGAGAGAGAAAGSGGVSSLTRGLGTAISKMQLGDDQVERHAAATYADCQNMARRMGKKLKQAYLNPSASNRNDPLRWICEFVPDENSDSRFEDHRYNSPDEYSAEPYRGGYGTNQPYTRSYRGTQPRNEGHRKFRRSGRQDFEGW